MDRFPLVKWHPKRYISWAWEVGEEDDERNTGHLGKEKKCFINSVGKRKWVLF